ncbi:MAG: c-type cytochrome biogenesis protein CcmI [Gammaproteobacteria bacterium]|nr:c-type cytochrome biogenesis protein CcmI [Gammaproteobacteria bacterium]
MIFWTVLTGLTLLAIGFAVLPFLRPGARTRAVHRGATLRALYRQRVAELNEESAAGIVNPASLEEMEQELGGVLLKEFQPDVEVQNGERSRVWMAVGLVVPVLAALIYQQVGEPDAHVLQRGAEIIQLDPENDTLALDRWRNTLMQRVSNKPDDAESWYLLGHIYLKTSRFQRAAEAFAMAHGVFGNDLSIDLYWLQARYLAADGVLDNASRELAEGILSRQANQPVVLEMLAIDAYRAGAYQRAVGLLNRALSIPQDALQQAALLAGLKQARSLLGDLKPSIDVRLSATETPPPNTTLFVIARPVGGGMPFAVVRRPAHPLPDSIRLDDAVSMNPAAPLSTAQVIEVVARISLAGTPMAHPGDWEWRSEPLVLSEVDLTITLAANLKPPDG